MAKLNCTDRSVKNALRVRVIYNSDFTTCDSVLSYVEPDDVEIMITKDNAVIRNEKISCVFSDSGYIEFYNGNNRILKEYYRNWRNANEHSPSMRFSAREFKPISGNDYEITIRFAANENEKIYGMGQYSIVIKNSPMVVYIILT